MKKYLPLGIIFIILVAILSLVWLSFFKSSGRTATLEVKPGDGTMSIAKVLKTKKVIFSPFIFYSYVHARHLILQPGIYDLGSRLNLIQIVQKIASGDSSEVAVTIPEGYRLTQIDALLKEKNLIESGDLIKIASSDEGKLFPDTYRFKKDATAEDIRKTMLDNFTKQTENLHDGNVDREVLIIASIVEREAKFDDDRARIAGVYFSRLDIGMRLQADPTIQYAKGSWLPITLSDYQNVSSPYNTYLHDGLPPTPICNPGIKSVQAALSPVKDGSLYFVSDSAGKAIFAKTLPEHNSNVRNLRK
ncbi:TPA: endolytic transglycosylase MltG [Candidatus Berkelbacteria bacterium]|uniref:Endolytic murein transglycosylase n=1 Tax=Berkelbacteria bacterium GW2011_GWE1_39_12 TaxID=1618337 RepID=A0A0G4B641_9BACT|nr:MAG: hypothetical protein UT28_C0001G0690 [Berkelbacteria bacterium GW2011_GWE1_39_12]HBO60427.1 endolytic transglycosylase MltG [Candidatus Berkelbacteria bacterium]